MDQQDLSVITDTDILDRLGAALSAKRQKAIDARVSQGIDERWYGDVEAYEGRDEYTRYYAGLRAAAQGYVSSVSTKQQTRSSLIVNVTRQKVNASSSRLQDIALPTDDRNWDLRPSTVPELVKHLEQKHLGLVLNGKPVMVDDAGRQRQASMADYATMTMEDAKKCAVAMRDEIDDQLDLSNDGAGYEGVVRAVIEDEALLGVGVGKGPVVTSRAKKVWMPISSGDRTVHVLQRIQNMKPGSSRVNPWDIYPHPECGENPKKFPIWERIPGVTAADLRGYADIPGYLREQIRKVLIEGPRKPEQQPDKPGVQVETTAETIYDCWEYHGDLTRDELEAAGCDCGGDDDVFTSRSGCVIMVNNTVIKADIEILDTGDMPYDFFVTNRASGSWAGYGVSFLARAAQKAITAGWRTMMDNAGMYVGPQVVMHRGKLTPADGVNEIRGMKLWYYNGDDDGADMRNLFAVHEINSHQAEYANIIKMGMDFLDSETAIPQLMQGEQGSASDTARGMDLLLNSGNVMIRRKLKNFDDHFTIPHIGRYVDWNMQYNPKNEIKGDFEVQARASGALMDMEVQNRAAMELLALVTNPALAHGMKVWDAVRRVIRARRFDPADFVKTDDEIKKIEEDMQKQGGQPAPAVQAAQIRAEAQVKVEEIQAKEATEHAVAAAQMDLQKQQHDAEEAQKDRALQLVIEQVTERVEAMKLTGAKEIALDQLKAMLAEASMKLNVQKDLSIASNALDLHKRHNPQVITPAAEPQGRAPNGEAFIK